MKRLLVGAVLLGPALAGCATATMPMGPRMAVMPAPGKPFEQFAAEERGCRGYAEQSVGISPTEATSQNVATGAVAGTALGTAVGAGQANESVHDLQWRYDLAYQQCMYAKGNQLPGGYAHQPPVTVVQVPAGAPVQVIPAPYPPPPPR